MSKKHESDIEKLLKIGKLGKAKLYRNIQTKIATGQNVKAAELLLARKLEEELQEDLDDRDEDYIFNSKKTAEFFDITRRNLSLWVSSGCPKETRGRFDLKKVFKWYLENIIMDKGEEEGDEKLIQWKRYYWKAKSQMEHVKLEEILGKLISKDEIKKEWVGRVAVVTSGLESLAERLPLVLEGKKRDEMVEIIKEEIRELRQSYARPSTWCPDI